ARRLDLRKDLAVGARDIVEDVGAGAVHARAHNVLRSGPEVGERLQDDLQAEARLAVRVGGGSRAVPRDRGRAGDRDVIADTDRARVSPDALVRIPREDEAALHRRSIARRWKRFGKST